MAVSEKYGTLYDCRIQILFADGTLKVISPVTHKRYSAKNISRNYDLNVYIQSALITWEEAHKEQVFIDNVAQYPQFQTAIDQLHDSAPQYAGALLSVFPEARSIVETEIENMLNNGVSPEDTVTALAEQINESISEYNELNY